ncbi:hypothetical protein IL306_000622 [Fusarium sp. DS 682]|nr:hypothetical protein IL306_000622 [Fusarium sp. DS 682]
MSQAFAISMTSVVMQEINRDIGPDSGFSWMRYTAAGSDLSRRAGAQEVKVPGSGGLPRDIVKAGSWRGTFWLPFGLDMAAFALVSLFYKPVNQYIRVDGRTRWQQFLGMDWVGQLLILVAVVLLGVGVEIGGITYLWAHAAPVTLLVVGSLSLVSLVLWEWYTDLETPIFPKETFSNIRGFTVILGGVVFLGMVYYTTFAFWPQQVAMLYTQDSISIGWYLSAMGDKV